jgi:hypothetical protein
MLKKMLFLLSFLIFSSQTLSQDGPSQRPFHDVDPLDNMPILERNLVGYEGAKPIPKRGPEFRRFLSPSCKISVGNSSGSGTIVHYDEKKNLAYVATCGHLWKEGVVDQEQAKKMNIRCKVIFWYHNDTRLDAPQSYEATVAFYSYIRGQDTGLITFTPDWKPSVCPIGPAEYKYPRGQHAHSCGCDAGSEVAHYDIEMMGLELDDLVTHGNSPRPGRSGGGLMDDDYRYIGTCWGTQYVDGTGKGFFTPLGVIHKFWNKQKDYAFLMSQSSASGKAIIIKIIDRSGSNEMFRPEYILLP